MYLISFSILNGDRRHWTAKIIKNNPRYERGHLWRPLHKFKNKNKPIFQINSESDQHGRNAERRYRARLINYSTFSTSEPKVFLKLKTTQQY